MSRRLKSLVVVLFILIADQSLKIWIKTTMSLGDEIVVFKNWFILHFVENNGMAFGFEFSISLIFAGAIGNIIDSLFYGLIFNHSYGQVSGLFPDGGGYAGFLHGRVVDMLYFPLIQGNYPNWIPFLGGNEFVFFRPVFNIADSSITIGIFSILIFYRKYFNKNEIKTEPEQEKQSVETA